MTLDHGHRIKRPSSPLTQPQSESVVLYVYCVWDPVQLWSIVGNPGVASLIPAWSHTFVEIDHEKFLNHSPPFRCFIQEGLLSVTSESMCTNYWLTALVQACPWKGVDWDVKQQNKQKKRARKQLNAYYWERSVKRSECNPLYPFKCLF